MGGTTVTPYWAHLQPQVFFVLFHAYRTGATDFSILYLQCILNAEVVLYSNIFFFGLSFPYCHFIYV